MAVATFDTLKFANVVEAHVWSGNDDQYRHAGVVAQGLVVQSSN